MRYVLTVALMAAFFMSPAKANEGFMKGDTFPTDTMCSRQAAHLIVHAAIENVVRAHQVMAMFYRNGHCVNFTGGTLEAEVLEVTDFEDANGMDVQMLKVSLPGEVEGFLIFPKHYAAQMGFKRLSL